MGLSVARAVRVSLLTLLVPSTFATLSACGEDEIFQARPDGGVPVVPDAAPPPAEAEASAPDAGGLAFGACPGGYSGACAKVDMPLDWKEPAGKKVGILIDKISSTRTPKAQLWLLQGGPGGTAADMVGLGREIAGQVADFEIFTIEHRGVGASNRLACPKWEAAERADAGSVSSVECKTEAVAAYGEDLKHYTTTNAARDLVRAIELTRRDGVKVFVLGGSYGTYWAQRFMQIAPTLASGVILDSIVVPGQQELTRFDEQGDPVARKVADLCKADAACMAALGPDPWAKIVATSEKMKLGHCPELGFGPLDRLKLRFLLQVHFLMGYALASWARIDRCTPADVTALRTLFRRVPLHGPNEALNSDVLHRNVVVSELAELPLPTKDTLQQRFDAVVFPAGLVFDYELLASWPRYARDELFGQLPEPKVPVLVLAGGLDTQTPIEIQEKSRARYTGPGLTFVAAPNANHGLLGQSPVPAIGGPPTQCGMTIAVQFLTDPKATLDTSCAAKVEAPSFDRPEPEINFLFGTSNLWLAGPSRVTHAEPPSIAALRELPYIHEIGAMHRSR